METETRDTRRVERREQTVAWFLLACGVGSGVLSAMNIVRRMETGWPSSHPWSTIASIVIPLAIVFLALMFVSVGKRKRVLAAIGFTLSIIGFACSFLALVL